MMNKQNKVGGYSLVEVMVAVGVTAIVALAASALLTDVFKKSTKAELANEQLTDQNVGSELLSDDLASSGINLNSTHVLDDNGKEFFEYFPYVPGPGIVTNDPRKITLALDTVRFKNAVKEFVFLRVDENWPIPLVFSPRKAYYVGKACKEGNSLVYNGNCFFDNIVNPEALKVFGSEVLTKTKGALYFFQVPEYFPNGNTSKLIELKTKLVSYSFLAPAIIENGTSVASGDIAISNVVSTSTSTVQGNPYTVVEPLHPTGKFVINNLDTYFKKIPFYAGEGTAFNLSRVRIIKYLVEKKKVAGRDSLALYRIVLKRISRAKFSLESSFLVAEGFEAVEISRKAVNEPIISINFDRQFIMTGTTKGGVGE